MNKSSKMSLTLLGKKTKWLVGLLIVCFAALAISLCSMTMSNAFGEEGDGDEGGDATVETAAVELTTTGASTDATKKLVSLNKEVYFKGDNATLNWQGSNVNRDFLIPVSIKLYYADLRVPYRTISTTELLDCKSFQISNDEYYRRMKQYATMADYSTIKNYLSQSHTVNLGTITQATDVYVEYAQVRPVYRLYNMITSEHLFSTNKAEYDNWVVIGKNNKDFWIGEGIAWFAPTTTTGTKTVSRLYNAALGAMGRSSHYYTSDTKEIKSLTSKYGWKNEGSTYGFQSGGDVPIYTCYNEALGSAHHYTSSKTEWEGLKQHGWDLEKSKNGGTGVFQGILATTWTFSKNFYTVNHQLENKSGGFDTVESEIVEGTAGSKTAAVAKTYEGYEAQSITQATINKKNNTVVNVKYNRASYKVTFDGNGQTIDTEAKTVKYGDLVTKPSSPVVTGYIFEGWFWDPEGENAFSFTNTEMPGTDITLYAKWDIDAYSVSYNKNTEDNVGGDWGAQRRLNFEDSTELKGDGLTRVGYTLSGWSFDKEGTQPATAYTPGQSVKISDMIEIAGEPDDKVIRLYAQWTENKYTVRYDTQTEQEVTGDLTDSVDQPYESPTTMKGSDIVRIGWEFIGWTLVPEYTGPVQLFEAGDTPTIRDLIEVEPEGGVVVMYAQWTMRSYNIHFDYNSDEEVTGDKTSILDVAYDSEVTLKGDDFYRFGWTFLGWTVDDKNVYPAEAWAGGSKVKVSDLLPEEVSDAKNINLYGKWEKDIYTVKYDKNAGSDTVTGDLSDQGNLSYDVDINMHGSDVARSGYRFDGWATSADGDVKYAYNASSMTFPFSGLIQYDTDKDKIVTLYAKWTAIFTLAYDSNGGQGTMTSQEGLVCADPFDVQTNTFTREDCVFDGWALEKNGKRIYKKTVKTISDLKPNAGDVVTLYAVWKMSDNSKFWIAPAKTSDKYTDDDPETCVLKTSSEIKNDVASIKAAQGGTVAQEYKTLMNDDAYHLYAKWNGETKDSSLLSSTDNSYAEFRIIQVGEHDSDGSGLTFQATHSLPTPQVMDVNSLNEGGWGNCDLSSAMNSASGSIYSNFTDGFKSSVLEVEKKYNAGSRNSSIISGNKYKFWLLSYSELVTAGTGRTEDRSGGADQNWLTGFNMQGEGSQYDFWKSKQFKGNDSNAGYEYLGRVRKNYSTASHQNLYPYGEETSYAGGTWLRSADPFATSNFVYVSGFYEGASGDSYTCKPLYGDANVNLGVVPAFCL